MQKEKFQYVEVKNKDTGQVVSVYGRDNLGNVFPSYEFNKYINKINKKENDNMNTNVKLKNKEGQILLNATSINNKDINFRTITPTPSTGDYYVASELLYETKESKCNGCMNCACGDELDADSLSDESFFDGNENVEIDD